METYNSAAKVIKFGKNNTQAVTDIQESAQGASDKEINAKDVKALNDVPLDSKLIAASKVENKARVVDIATKKIADLRPLNLYKALLNTQTELPTIYKSAKAYNYKYVTYEALAQAVFPCMHKHGLLYTATIEGTRLECKLIHADSGQFLMSAVSLDAGELNGSKMLYPQKIGSLISYYKRYILGAFLGLGSGAEDVEQIQMKMEQSANIARQAQNTKVREY